MKRREPFTSLFDIPATVGHLTVHNDTDAPLAVPFNDDDTAERFAHLETLVVIHHASEALLRLILAHQNIPPLPWLELSKMRNFKKFKDQVSKLRRMTREQLTDLVGPIIIGNTNCTDDQRAKASSTYAQVVRQAAIHFLDESNLYNAAKHGLAVNPSRASFTMTPENEVNREASTVTLADGGALEYLESKEEDGAQIWQLTTNMIDLAQLITFAGIVCDTIASLWSVARATYTSDSSGRVWLPQNTLVELLPSRAVGSMYRFSEVLGAERSGSG